MSCQKWFDSHKWKKWEVKEQGDLTRWSTVTKRDLLVGTYMIQERECDVCGLKEIKSSRNYA